MRSLLCAAALLTATAAWAATPAIPGIVTRVYAGQAIDLPLPDFGNNTPGTLIDLILVGDQPGVVMDVDVTISVEHTQPDQLDMYLISPSGTTITLTTDNGGGFDDVFAATTFDDQAAGTPSAPNVRNFTYADLVPTGPVQPEGALGAVVGEPAVGPWALVVIDDTGGTRGTLVGWSLTLSTVPAVHPEAPRIFSGGGDGIPSNDPDGLAETIAVAGLGTRLHDVDVTVDIVHPNASDLDVYLTSPSGRRIDLVTDLGGGNDDLFAGAIFDDQAGAPVSDATLPASGTPFFEAVIPEGALAAFIGEDPNGIWTLTVVDDAAGSSGELLGWTLRLVTATACGDGVLDAVEVCDDGNAVSGDGCDLNCTPTACGNGVVAPGEDCDDGNRTGGDGCPSTCLTHEAACGDCIDDDENGFVDLHDPACAAEPLELRYGTIGGPASPRGRLKLRGGLSLPAVPAGPVGLVLGDATGTVLCAALGTLGSGTKARSLKARIGGAPITLKIVPRRGSFLLAARGLDLGRLDDPGVLLGLGVAGRRYVASGTFRPHGSKWVYP